ncbi:MAG: GGDEF domain-containing phosphodiesterase [Sphingorhabdus sp.]
MDSPAQQRNMRLARTRDAREWLAAYDRDRDGPAAVMLIGIRDLKQINDRHGRDSGDEAIRNTGKAIIQFSRETRLEVALVGRMPGREFMLVARGNLSNATLKDEARKLIELLSTPPGKKGVKIPVSVRIGVAKAAKADSGPEILHRATSALADAYAHKGERIAFARASASSGKRIANILDTGLRDAIAASEIAIMLQPQFAVQDGKLIGAEALARWHHPEFGEIGADQLFASADRCDLREELSQLLQEEAIRTAADWPVALDDLKLSVNLGAGELSESYAANLSDVLDRTGFPVKRLTLELTEESLIRDLEAASGQLEKLRDKGISIALDDFGTGYSSLAYLKTLPLDYLKLDKSMTPDIKGEGKERIVLRAIIAMGQALGLKIIAEGVESKDELEMLRAEGCDYFQGFLMAPPLTPVEFERFALRSN